ncbi:unnamed protein product [Anisakis simplex]|uniref:Uncharacterized protein n=1 Tax=Anisakis simplex TaxID=6269 RepID=A0A0M3JPE5_ANISI|nr:unnamed protein product [Anisakis simplex]
MTSNNLLEKIVQLQVELIRRDAEIRKLKKFVDPARNSHSQKLGSRIAASRTRTTATSPLINENSAWNQAPTDDYSSPIELAGGSADSSQVIQLTKILY